MYYFSIFIVMLDCLVIIYGQMNSLGSTEYCAELKPQINLTIAQITGKWYVAEVITHRETVYGENLTGDCIKIVINEINEQMVTKRPRQFNEVPKDFDRIGSSRPIPTQPPPIQEQPRPTYRPPQQYDDQNMETFSEINFPFNDSSTVFPLPALSQISFDNPFNYDHLRLEWTESNTKWEYIARYSRLRNGLWMASAPQQYRSSELPNFKVNAGTIEVIGVDENYLVLKFCEIIPRQQLFTIILGRQPNSIPFHAIRDIRNKLRAFHLPTVYQRRICNGNGGTSVSHNSLMIVFIVASIASVKMVQQN